MKVFIVDLKKNILSPQFIISVFVFLLLFLLSDAPLISPRNPMSVLDEIVRFRKDKWIEKGTEFFYLNILFRFDNSLWYSIVLPVLSSFSALYSFKNEWFTDSYVFTLSRYGYKQFAFSKMLASFFTGLLSFLCGILLFLMITYLIFPKADSFGDSITLSFNYHLFCDKIICNAILCGMYGMLSILFLLLIKDYFFTLCLYVVIEYFSMRAENKLQNMIMEEQWENRTLLLLFPNRFNDMYYLIPDYTNISFYWYIPLTAVIGAIMALIALILIKRRYKYCE